MTRFLPSQNAHSRLQRLWVFGLVFALAFVLLLSQSLAQLHAVKHAVKHGGPAGVNHAAAAHVAHEDHGFLEQLFSNHNTDTDCRLYDQLGDGHAMPAVALLELPVVLPSLKVAIFQGEALARWAALFDARGPPLTF